MDSTPGIEIRSAINGVRAWEMKVCRWDDERNMHACVCA